MVGNRQKYGTQDSLVYSVLFKKDDHTIQMSPSTGGPLSQALHPRLCMWKKRQVLKRLLIPAGPEFQPVSVRKPPRWGPGRLLLVHIFILMQRIPRSLCMFWIYYGLEMMAPCTECAVPSEPLFWTCCTRFTRWFHSPHAIRKYCVWVLIHTLQIWNWISEVRDHWVNHVVLSSGPSLWTKPKQRFAFSTLA